MGGKKRKIYSNKNNYKLISLIFLSLLILFFILGFIFFPEFFKIKKFFAGFAVNDFLGESPINGTITTNTSVVFNISISQTSGLSQVKWNWNGNNYSVYDNSLVLMLGFNNLSNLGESESNFVDSSIYGNNAACSNYCSGSHNGCGSYESDSGTCTSHGCDWGLCSSPTGFSCDNFDNDQSNCTTIGCSWDGCIGASPNACNSHSSSDECATFGCTWGYCGGAPSDCSSFGEIQCGGSGCSAQYTCNGNYPCSEIGNEATCISKGCTPNYSPASCSAGGCGNQGSCENSFGCGGTWDGSFCSNPACGDETSCTNPVGCGGTWNPASFSSCSGSDVACGSGDCGGSHAECSNTYSGCAGTPDPCGPRTQPFCGGGCGWSDSCTGTPSACSTLLNSSNCLIAGCTWNGCSGTPNCNVFNTNYDNCVNFGCNFNNCTGTPHACLSFGDQASCDTHAEACSWKENVCPTYASGKYGNALMFDGINNLIKISSSNSLPSLGKKTFAAWLKFNASENTGLHNILSIGASPLSNDGGLGAMFIDSGRFTYKRNYNIAPKIMVSIDSGIIGDNTWHYVITEYNGTNALIYVDGILMNSSIVSDYSFSATSAWIGGSSVSPDWDQNYPFKGSIDEVRIWNRSLTQSEINEMYMGNLYKYNSTQWYFNINQSKNIIAGLSDGTYSYYLSSKNNTGTEVLSEKRWITIGTPDTTPPSVSGLITVPNLPILINSSLNININFSTSDNLINLTFILYNSSGGVVYNEGPFVINISINLPYLFTVPVGINDGNYTLNMTITDLTGNSNTTLLGTIAKDSIPPIISSLIISPTLPASFFPTSNISINFSSSEYPVNLTFALYNSSGGIAYIIGPIRINSSSNLPSMFIVPAGINDGNYTLNMTITDLTGNSNTTLLGTIAKNTPIDSDNDGIPDSNDTLIGNQTSLMPILLQSGSTINFIFKVNGTSNSVNPQNGTTQQVVFYDGTIPIVNFSWNFITTNPLNLSRITIGKQLTANTMTIFANLSGQFNGLKTMYISDNSFIGLCVKNIEISGFSDISSGCNDAYEYNTTLCLNNATGYAINGTNITCFDEGSIIRVENLSNSGLRGTFAASVPISNNAGTSSNTGTSTSKKSLVENKSEEITVPDSTYHNSNKNASQKGTEQPEVPPVYNKAIEKNKIKIIAISFCIAILISLVIIYLVYHRLFSGKIKIHKNSKVNSRKFSHNKVIEKIKRIAGNYKT